MDLTTVAQALSVWFLPVIVAITFHEAAHGWMAERCGDDTARMLGRVSFNPIRHVDPFGTLLLPGLLLLLKAPFLFGYAKPVPVNFGRLRHPKRDMIWVALAGPGVNVLLAFAAALLLHPRGLRAAGAGAVARRESRERDLHQRRARRVQHAAAAAAGRRQGAHRSAAARRSPGASPASSATVC